MKGPLDLVARRQGENSKLADHLRITKRLRAESAGIAGYITQVCGPDFLWFEPAVKLARQLEAPGVAAWCRSLEPAIPTAPQSELTAAQRRRKLPRSGGPTRDAIVERAARIGRDCGGAPAYAQRAVDRPG